MVPLIEYLANSSSLIMTFYEARVGVSSSRGDLG